MNQQHATSAATTPPVNPALWERVAATALPGTTVVQLTFLGHQPSFDNTLLPTAGKRPH